jgi:glycolate oxidase iron-sulfur subunit
MARALAGRNPLRFALGMLAATTPAKLAPVRSRPDSRASGDATAILFRGCIMEGLFAHVHEATRRVLAANGIAVEEVAGQECCGALHAHAGQHREAVSLARRNVAAFAAASQELPVVVNAAGCGATLKAYGRLLADDPLRSAAAAFANRVKDVSEVLAAVGLRRGALPGVRVAYDPPCHLLHAQGIARQPLDVLDAIDGIEHVAHEEAELCCGSAGSFTFSQPEISGAVLDRKITALKRADPDVVATGNPGCIMQIGAGLRAAGLTIPVVHPVELLDASYHHAGHHER